MRIVTNNYVEEKKWNDLLNNGLFASIFQTPDFFNFFNSMDDLHADVFAVEIEGKYTALITITIQKERGIKAFFSRRGIIYGGPLLISDGNNSLANLLTYMNSFYKQKLIYIEVRNNYNYKDYLRTYIDHNWKYESHLNVFLNLKNRSIENVISAMKYNRRREIKISYKNGAYVKSAENENEINSLYKILRELYLDKVKLPLPPLSFFQDLYKSTIGKVFIVYHHDNIIGGAFCIFQKGVSIHTLYYAGLRNYYKKIFPTHLAIMGVIEFAINNDIKKVDFMGAGKPGTDYGVRDYKMQFGGELVEYGRFINVLNPFLYTTGKAGLTILSKFN